MFDLGWGELLIIGVVALIVVGPKDLPGMFRTLGRFTGKIKRMAREFQRAMDDAADEAGVKDAANVMKGATNPTKMGLNTLDEAAKKFDDWDPTSVSKDYGKGKGGAAASDDKPALSEERAEAAKKIHDYSAKKTAENRAAEAKAEAAQPTKATKAKTTKAKTTKAKTTKAKTAKAKTTKAKAAKAKAKPDSTPEDPA